MNIFDYIENTKNTKLDNLNILDIMILTRLSYIHLEDITDKLPMIISDINKYIKDIKINHNDKKLIDLLKDSLRFKDLIIKRCKHVEDINNDLMFTGITINLPNNSILVSFRGTGKNPYDFKEDMNMSYKIVPSCIEAVKYLEEEKGFHKLFISGHSKGGHIAMFAGSHTTFFNKVKIEKIYNFDGPGFLEITKEFKTMQSKIVNYFPEGSIVGRMMHHIGDVKVIKTNKSGIEAHSIYNWKIENNDLVDGKLNNNSHLFHEECLKVLKVIPKEKRKAIIDYVFTLMLKGEIKSFKELDLIKVKDIVNNVPHLEKDEKESLMKFFKVLIKCMMPEIKK